MSIYKKLADIQSELHAPKRQINDFGGYQYRSCEDILQAVKPLLNDYALTIVDELVFSGILEDEIIGAGNKAMKVQTQRVYIKAVVTLTSSDGKESITTSAVAREASIKKGMDASQVSGATSSYARKYALNGLFAIDDTKDSDSTNKHDEDKVQDMSLEGLAGVRASEPKKRVDKEAMQKAVIEIVFAHDGDDQDSIIKAWTKLKRHEKKFVWYQLSSKQQKKIREVTFKGAA